MEPTANETAAMMETRLRGLPTEVEFLRLANGEGRRKARTRIFGYRDYLAFCDAVTEAAMAAGRGEAYYATDDAGSVANAYKYPAETAQWGVWAALPGDDRPVVWTVGRARANNRHVGCPYPGGERSYIAEFNARKIAAASA